MATRVRVIRLANPRRRAVNTRTRRRTATTGRKRRVASGRTVRNGTSGTHRARRNSATRDASGRFLPKRRNVRRHRVAVRANSRRRTRRNVAAGYYDEDEYFHPIRASYDYSSSRVGEKSRSKPKPRSRSKKRNPARKRRRVVARHRSRARIVARSRNSGAARRAKKERRRFGRTLRVLGVNLPKSKRTPGSHGTRTKGRKRLSGGSYRDSTGRYLSARKKARRNSSTRRKNPGLLVTLGSVNPKRRKANSTMARRRKNRRHTARRTHHKRRNSTRIVVVSPRRRANRRHGRRRYANPRRRNAGRRRNPVLFGQSMSPMNTGKTVLGVLVGVTAAKMIPPMLPASLTSSTPMRILVTGAVAFASGMLARKAGSAVSGFADGIVIGGLAQTVSIALNAFLPSIGSQIGLSGRPGMGDLVPGGFPIPQNPVNVAALMPPPAMATAGVKGVFGRTF